MAPAPSRPYDRRRFRRRPGSLRAFSGKRAAKTRWRHAAVTMARSRTDDPWKVRARPDEAVGAVAVRVLSARLFAIPGLLRRAAAPSDDGEAVHALRVATRRTRAALDLFGPLLRRRRRKRFARLLGVLRHAAGECRDLDVLVERLCDAATGEHEPADGPRKGMERALATLREEQRAARAPIVRLARKFEARAWHRRSGRLVRTIRRRRSTERFEAFASRALEATTERFMAAAGGVARAARRAAPTAEAIHDLRILAKKTRYTLEIVAAVRPLPPGRQGLAWFEHFQEAAGEFTDHVRAADRLRRVRRDATRRGVRRALRRLVEAEERAAARALVAVRAAIGDMSPAGAPRRGSRSGGAAARERKSR